MPWMNLRFLLGVLQRRRVDPAEVSVYLTPRDAARLGLGLPVDAVPDSDGPESDDDDTEAGDEDEDE